MKTDVLERTRAHAAGRVHLHGSVAGATACELVADSDEIVVGADPACDLQVLDPTLPPQAFRLRRIKCHADSGEECRCHWVIESDPRARIYVNQQITPHRERLLYGDVVECGCHHFVFARADSAARNRRLHQNVSDLCALLLAGHAAPPGFIKNSPFYRYLRRRRQALTVAGSIATILLLLAILTPRKERFESVVAPLEVQVADATVIPPDMVRSLDTVARQAYQPAEPPPEAPELADRAVTPPPDPAARPRMLETAKVEAPELADKPVVLARLEPLPLAAETPAETPVERTAARLEPAATTQPRRSVTPAALSVDTVQLAEYTPDKAADAATPRAIRAAIESSRPDLPAANPAPANWQLPILPPAPVQTADATVRRETASLAGSTPPVRRLSRSEAVQMSALAAETAGLRTRQIGQPGDAPVTRAAVRDVLASLQKPATDGIMADPAKAFEQLAAYRASPVEFESFQGLRVPVVRMTEQLAQLEVVGTPDPIKVDGSVSDSEIAISWKSGQFSTHAPGQPPPKADPATYCYVGKTTIDGKPCLYIAFTCVDPDVSKLIARSNSGDSSGIVRDDSVEIFLDVNNDRKDYYQLIANAKGAWWSAYYPQPMIEGTIQTPSQPWDAGATVKTSVTREPGQWVCEVVIPFDRIGGVPAKGTRWAVNFARNFRGQIEDWQLQSWFAVYDKSRNFHHPSLFGIFQW